MHDRHNHLPHWDADPVPAGWRMDLYRGNLVTFAHWILCWLIFNELFAIWRIEKAISQEHL
jgi:hypothetical protein